MTDDRIRVVIADDHPLIRRGLRAVLSADAGIEIVAEAGNCREAIEQYRAFLPDLLLLDLQMPDGDGCDAIWQLREEFPNAAILVLTTYAKDTRAMRALAAGALGYILKSDLHDELIKAIRAVHAGEQYLSGEVARVIARHAGDHSLTEREHDVLSLAAAGNSNKRIAAKLALSEETIKGYMKIILGKLDAVDRTHAVTIAARRGIIEL